MYDNVKYNIHNKLIKQISEELNIEQDVIEKVIRSQWDFLEQMIGCQDDTKRFFSLKMRYLGLFGVKNTRFLYTKNYKHLYVPRDKITKNIDPRTQDTY